MDKYKGKYRNESARHPTWDYANAGLYFITICTRHRKHFFGEINLGKMELSDIGKIAEQEWLKTFEMRPDMNLWMGEFVVMPDHFHAVIGIGKNEFNTQNTSRPNKFGPQSKNLASIIRGFKIGVTTNARKTNPDFAWQSLYHDRIIRNEKSHLAISNYIENNVRNWKKDKLN
ncbi:transposase [Leeuwenhoekiella parthenopeia]|uniref:Transposase n=1 Tax=Leeuwenhoekiella parthenopeia TaxID=2890320 RepID=A0ABS8GV41_9FLAO|nr:transposase [Leeuwenhoekiella parthenopeia]MCC4213884.1 transposase [Leeuwenhoekiella parthenopeia]